VNGPLDYGPYDKRILAVLRGLDADQVRGLEQAMAQASTRLGLDYVRDSGEVILIPVNPTPVVPTRRQMSYLMGVIRTLNGAVARVAAQRLKDPVLSAMLELSDQELEWLRLARKAPGNPAQRVFHRWDLAIALAGDVGAAHARFFEVNSVDVGGIHYAAATRQALLDALEAVGVSGLSLDASTAGSDPRLVLLESLREHARAIGRKPRMVAIAENQDFTTGITEASSLAEFFTERGLPTECVDVRAFEVNRRGRVFARGRPVDVVYRNIELRDLVELEQAGANLSGLKAAASAGLLFSSPYGELDHKSLWEVLGAPDHWPSLSPLEQKMVSRHIPWTRLLTHRITQSPTGRMVDLPDYVHRHRTRLVLKPNRSCGGQGVTIGAITAAAAWDQTLSQALEHPCSWVAQELIPIPRRRSLVVGRNGCFRPETVYAVYGVFCSAAGLAFVGRASRKPVVNVMQGGSMLGILGHT
jgi:hypothetical protein